MDLPFIVTPENELFILRDDMIPGGTKRRALRLMLPAFEDETIIYAGTTMGHGALALAHACIDTGKKAVIFIAGTDDNPMVKTIREAGAAVYLRPPRPITALHQEATLWANQNGGKILPPGFDMPAFGQAMIDALRPFDFNPYTEIWTPAVSGTLTRALQAACPSKPFHAVAVVQGNYDIANASLHSAPEKYHRPALAPPPYPACAYTDAKLWQFAVREASPGALIWNTAG